MTQTPLFPAGALLAALALATPAAASPPGVARGAGPSLLVPESSLRLLLRNRDQLGLDAGQVLTLELKDAELQRRAQERVDELTARPEPARGGAPSLGGGPQGGGMGPPLGGVGPASGGVERGGGGRRGQPADPGAERRRAGEPGAGEDARARRVLGEVETMDRAAVEGVRRIFTDAQRPKVEALLARRAELLSRSRGAPPPPEHGSPR